MALCPGPPKRYKLFWMGSEAKTEGVGIFVAEKWVDSVVSVERHNERIMVLKMVLGDRLLGTFPQKILSRSVHVLFT